MEDLCRAAEGQTDEGMACIYAALVAAALRTSVSRDAVACAVPVHLFGGALPPGVAVGNHIGAVVARLPLPGRDEAAHLRAQAGLDRARFQNATLRANVLFGQPDPLPGSPEERRYYEILDACALLERAYRPVVFFHVSKAGGTSVCLMALANGERVRTDAGDPSFLAGRCAAAGLPYFCQRCGHRHQLMKNDSIRCTLCYHRILYKGRTTHSVVIEVD